MFPPELDDIDYILRYSGAFTLPWAPPQPQQPIQPGSMLRNLRAIEAVAAGHYEGSPPTIRRHFFAVEDLTAEAWSEPSFSVLCVLCRLMAILI